MIKLIEGNSLEKLKELEENSVDSVVTDPPYGLEFMGKKWDYDVPSVELWKEVYRVLKPGGYVLSFAGTRTQHRMAINIEDAGFEIRDMIAWIYGSGFPKSLNVGNSVKEINDSDEWEGWGTALKPALEPITVARKPISEKNIAENIIKWGTGGINIDKSRVPTDEEIKNHSRSAESAISKGRYGDSKEQQTHQTSGQKLGRYPSNLIIDDEAGKLLDEQSGLDRGAGGPVKSGQSGKSNGIYGDYASKGDDGKSFRGDTGGASRFFYKPKPNKLGRFPSNLIIDEEAGKLLDEQSGITTSGKVKEDKDSYSGNSNTGFLRGVSNSTNQHGDTGGASRFFYQPKASKIDREEGLEDFEVKQTTGGGGGVGNYLTDVNSASGKYGSEKAPSKNHHPTVKPTALMEYLVNLVTHPNGTVLDPFMGSGSTGKACKRLGFRFIGIDLEGEYVRIAKARIDNAPMEDAPITKQKQAKKINKFFDL